MARRDSGTGSIYRRTDRDGWWIAVPVVDEHGRRRKVKRKGGDTLREARATLKTLLAELRERPKVLRADTTLAVYLVREHLPLLKARLDPHSYTCARGRLRLAAHRLGARPVHQVNRSDAERLLADVRAGWKPGDGDSVPEDRRQRSPSTVAAYRSALTGCWKALEARGLVESNPWRGVAVGRAQQKTVPFLTEEELAKLYKHVAPRYRPAVILLGETGLRRGELLALRWADVRLSAEPPHLVASVTKSRRVRPVPLRPLALEALEQLRRRAKDGRPHPSERICSSIGQTWHKDAREAFEAAVEALGKGRITPHGLRHVRACLLVRAGVPVVDVARWLGHADATLVLQRYGHHAPEDHLTAALRLSVGGAAAG